MAGTDAVSHRKPGWRDSGNGSLAGSPPSTTGVCCCVLMAWAFGGFLKGSPVWHPGGHCCSHAGWDWCCACHGSPRQLQSATPGRIPRQHGMVFQTHDGHHRNGKLSAGRAGSRHPGNCLFAVRAGSSHHPRSETMTGLRLPHRSSHGSHPVRRGSWRAHPAGSDVCRCWQVCWQGYSLTPTAVRF